MLSKNNILGVRLLRQELSALIDEGNHHEWNANQWCSYVWMTACHYSDRGLPDNLVRFVCYQKTGIWVW